MEIAKNIVGKTAITKNVICKMEINTSMQMEITKNIVKKTEIAKNIVCKMGIKMAIGHRN